MLMERVLKGHDSVLLIGVLLYIIFLSGPHNVIDTA